MVGHGGKATFAEADPEQEDGAYDKAQRLARHVREPVITGLGWTKIYKFLHVKRPALYPILDERLRVLYASQSLDWTARLTPLRAQEGRLYWPALRADVVNPANQTALSEARAEMHAAGGALERVALLPDVRLLDIVA